MGAGQLAPAARRHRHRCRQQWPECMLVRSPEQDAPMPGSPSGGCTPVGVLDAGGTALGTWPWGLASWHQQRAATATAAASSGLNACWWAALSRMLLCLALRHSVTHMYRHRMGGQHWGAWPWGLALAPAARRHRHRCRQQCLNACCGSPEQDAPMPGSPSGGCTPVGVLDAGGTALGTWPWGLASWHQQRAATATAAASSARNACCCEALNRMLLCL